MVETNTLSLAEKEAAAAAAFMAGFRRSGQYETILAKQGTPFGPTTSWFAGDQPSPPTTGYSTYSGDRTDEENDYYARLLIEFPSLAWAPSEPDNTRTFYCTQTLAGGIITASDAANDKVTVELYHRVRITYNGAWAPGNPAVGDRVAATANALREVGVYYAEGVVVAHDTVGLTIDILITNGASFADGDVLTSGANSYTIDVAGAGDTIGAPATSVPGQNLTWAVAESGSFLLGDKIQGVLGAVTVTGIVTAFSGSANTMSVVPAAAQAFGAGMAITNLSRTGSISSLASATWDQLVAFDGVSYATTLQLADGVTISELTNGSVKIWNDPARPTITPAELGQHWPIALLMGPSQQDRTEQLVEWTVASPAGWLPGHVVTGVDDQGTVTCKIKSYDGGLKEMVIVPQDFALHLGGAFRVGMVVTNASVGGSLTVTATSYTRSYWPSGHKGIGASGWRRCFPTRKGMLGRRGGSVVVEAVGKINSTDPGGETNVLEIIVVANWRYAAEFGGLREVPQNKRLGWRIEVPPTLAQGGFFHLSIEGRGVHTLAQMWSGRIVIVEQPITEFADYTVTPLVDKPLLPIYRSFVGGAQPYQPEAQDCNFAVCVRCDGTAGGGVGPPQPFATVGASTILQDGSRLKLSTYIGEVRYRQGI
jgi:hypothetical protein